MERGGQYIVLDSFTVIPYRSLNEFELHVSTWIILETKVQWNKKQTEE